MAFVNTVTLSAPPWTEQSAVYHARSLRRLVRLASRGRSGVVKSGDFAVTPTSPASMQVQVAPGDAVALSPGAGLGSYIPYQDSTPLNVTIPASDPTNPANHLVCIRILDSDYQGSVISATLGVLQGTPAAGVNASGTGDPTVPTDGIYLPLARVTLPAGASSVTAAMITDIRQVVGFGTSPLLATPGAPIGGTWTDGDVVLDSLGNQWARIGGQWKPLGLHRIGSDTLATASATTATIAVPIGYKTLQVKGWASSTGANTTVNLILNGSTVGYGGVFQFSTGGTPAGGTSASAEGRFGSLGASLGSAFAEVTGIDQAAPKGWTGSSFRWEGGTTFVAETNGGVWNNNAPVTSVRVASDSTMKAGSRFDFYAAG